MFILHNHWYEKTFGKEQIVYLHEFLGNKADLHMKDGNDQFYVNNTALVIKKMLKTQVNLNETPNRMYNNAIDDINKNLKAWYKQDLTDITAKDIYNHTILAKYKKANSITKWEEELNIHQFRENDIKMMFKLAHHVNINSKLQNFQYKYIHRIIYTNKLLCKLKMTESTLCSFCLSDIETVNHLFIYCTYTQRIWNEMYEIFAKANINVNITHKEIHLGCLDKSVFDNFPKWSFVNQIIFLTKYYVYKSKLEATIPTCERYRAFLQSRKSLELEIFKTNKKILNKWTFLPHTQT
ncbi:hypothetical protein SNE40_008396 [Patella caerulea]|uniref:Reverse transcriptase zinc-binding domain-containing protein n=1 Tax=Patella caerulea TaxID=87958 RepID=A0AAN8PYX8_PATCE